ncbi:DUF2510 domain-containing protein [Mycobacterium hodleri]|uniref:DUF2510 domain-containing protein n=1 Tax=Mycolicibacterium hodleri TaxID=49897 RepID=UPI0021F2F92E|nr:DUF2510 domain-containing protein [Mycolicibacterium hodleri]MCV7136655.1 DUF2510 domain-containing protein [Mycolicibacterium hodleri]
MRSATEAPDRETPAMTTPPTPANWYPDPENPGGLRYWDGWTWTEHRAPAPGQATSPSDEAANVYATRPVVQEPTPEGAQEQPVQPYDTHPPAVANEPPVDDATSWNPPLPSWDSLSTEPERTDDPAPEPSHEEPPTESQTPTADTTTAFEPAAFAPPPGPPPGYYPAPPPPSGKSNTKLIIGLLAGGAVLLVVIAVVVALVVMRTDKPTAASQPSSSATSSSETTTSPTDAAPTPTESLTPPPPGAVGTDGDYSFSIAGTETGDTITSTVSDAVETTADGMYYVVYLNVTNTGAAPQTFVATFQQLSAAGQTFPLDDEATAFLGGTTAEIGPGEQRETPLVYDVPMGTEPSTIVLHADPSTAGVELPLS